MHCVAIRILTLIERTRYEHFPQFAVFGWTANVAASLRWYL